MVNIIANMVKRNNYKTKASAQRSKLELASQQNALKQEQPKPVKSPEVQLAKESKTLMLDV